MFPGTWILSCAPFQMWNPKAGASCYAGPALQGRTAVAASMWGQRRGTSVSCATIHREICPSQTSTRFCSTFTTERLLRTGGGGGGGPPSAGGRGSGPIRTHTECLHVSPSAGGQGAHREGPITRGPAWHRTPMFIGDSREGRGRSSIKF